MKNKFKKFRVFLYTSTILGGIYKIFDWRMKASSKKIAKTSDNTPENTEGYDDISLTNNNVVHTNNFVIFHVNRNSNVTDLREKIEFCQKNNISIGLVLDTEAENLTTIYQDVDFLQAIVKEYKIDLPVYCNIDNIMNSTKLNNAQRLEIMEAFTDKISRSDMYFGFYGTDTNLCNCKEYVLDTYGYDCYIVQDSNSLKYQGTSTIKKDLNGNITSNLDLSKTIIENGFNKAHKLVYSAKYKIKENDTYHSLALKYGLSEEDLRQYNGNDETELKEGNVISIPNLYKSVNKNTNEVTYNYAIARGIDISDYQSKINWDKVAETSEFVIVEVARDPMNYEENGGTYINECATQIKNTVENNIELGLYFCISSDMKVSVYEERLEQYLTILDKELEKNNITLERENIPVFLDFEIYYQYNDYYKLMTTFENLCKNHGFTKIGIYGNASTLKAISSSLNNGEEHIELKDTDWFVWQSGGAQYSSHENTDEGYTLSQIEEPKNQTNAQYTIHIQQATNVCKDTGAENHVGNCDVNFCYSQEVFGTTFDDEEDEFCEYVSIDLDQYKNVSAKTIFTTAINALIALECIIVAADLIGRKLIFKIKTKRLSEHSNQKTKK